MFTQGTKFLFVLLIVIFNGKFVCLNIASRAWFWDSPCYDVISVFLCARVAWLRHMTSVRLKLRARLDASRVCVSQGANTSLHNTLIAPDSKILVFTIFKGT